MMTLRSLSHALSIVVLSALLGSCGADRPRPAPDRGSPPPAGTPPPVQTAAPAAAPQATTERGTPPSGTLAYTGALPPLPISNFPSPRPPELVRAVYEFAARRPDVLRYVPCFCGCERHGHVHNEHCFVAGREADGKPRWESHGMG